MLSLRLEPQLLQELREFAEQRGLTVSDVLRQAAVDLLGRASQAQFVVSIAQVETQQAIRGISVQKIPTGTGSMASDPAPRVA
jgi:Ribbon-helix-helix protein, copG family